MRAHGHQRTSFVCNQGHALDSRTQLHLGRRGAPLDAHLWFVESITIARELERAAGGRRRGGGDVDDSDADDSDADDSDADDSDADVVVSKLCELWVPVVS